MRTPIERGSGFGDIDQSGAKAKSTSAKPPRSVDEPLEGPDASATLMLASGVPAKVAVERLGHAEPTLFTNLYSHVALTMRREAAAKINSALFD